MKKILTLALGLVLLISCSSDDSGSSTIDQSLLTNKNWYPVSIKVSGITIPYEHENIQCGKDYNRFDTGGVFKSVYFNSQCIAFTDLGSWIIEGNKIVTNEEGNITSLDINKLTATELIVSGKTDYNEDGVEETAIYTLSVN